MSAEALTIAPPSGRVRIAANLRVERSAPGEDRTRTVGMTTRVGAGRVYQFRHGGTLLAASAGSRSARRSS